MIQGTLTQKIMDVFNIETLFETNKPALVEFFLKNPNWGKVDGKLSLKLAMRRYDVPLK